MTSSAAIAGIHKCSLGLRDREARSNSASNLASKSGGSGTSRAKLLSARRSSFKILSPSPETYAPATPARGADATEQSPPHIPRPPPPLHSFGPPNRKARSLRDTGRATDQSPSAATQHQCLPPDRVQLTPPARHRQMEAIAAHPASAAEQIFERRPSEMNQARHAEGRKPQDDGSTRRRHLA
jgi:hypothetical protein